MTSLGPFHFHTSSRPQLSVSQPVVCLPVRSPETSPSSVVAAASHEPRTPVRSDRCSRRFHELVTSSSRAGIRVPRSRSIRWHFHHPPLPPACACEPGQPAIPDVPCEAETSSWPEAGSIESRLRPTATRPQADNTNTHAHTTTHSRHIVPRRRSDATAGPQSTSEIQIRTGLAQG